MTQDSALAECVARLLLLVGNLAIYKSRVKIVEGSGRMGHTVSSMFASWIVVVPADPQTA